jgi:hypothetical protein
MTNEPITVAQAFAWVEAQAREHDDDATDNYMRWLNIDPDQVREHAAPAAAALMTGIEELLDAEEQPSAELFLEIVEVALGAAVLRGFITGAYYERQS